MAWLQNRMACLPCLKNFAPSIPACTTLWPPLPVCRTAWPALWLQVCLASSMLADPSEKCTTCRFWRSFQLFSEPTAKLKTQLPASFQDLPPVGLALLCMAHFSPSTLQRPRCCPVWKREEALMWKPEAPGVSEGLELPKATGFESFQSWS